LGSEEFKRQILRRMEASLGGHHSGELDRQVADSTADRIIAGELGRCGWREEDLLTRRKNDSAGLELQRSSAGRSTLPLNAIASARTWAVPSRPIQSCTAICAGPLLPSRNWPCEKVNSHDQNRP
jgi:hypothetical protein